MLRNVAWIPPLVPFRPGHHQNPRSIPELQRTGWHGRYYPHGGANRWPHQMNCAMPPYKPNDILTYPSLFEVTVCANLNLDGPRRKRQDGHVSFFFFFHLMLACCYLLHLMYVSSDWDRSTL